MNVDFDIGFSIACVCLFIVLVTLIIFSGWCETIEEEIGLSAHRNEGTITAHSSESTIEQNPIQNI